MERKQILFGLGVVSGGAAIVGSGAFSSVDADREVNVDVSGDKSAFLKLKPAEGANGDYATITDEGLLAVEMSDENDQILGDGVNQNARTSFGDVFAITNQGTQEVGIWIEHEAEHVEFESNGSVLDDPDAPLVVEPGQEISVGLRTDTRGTEPDVDRLLDGITIHASADEESDVPELSAERSIMNPEPSPGEETIITIDLEIPNAVDVDVFERFDTALGDSSLEAATLDGSSIMPEFVELGEGGGIVLFNELDGNTSLEYTLTISSDAPAGEYSFEPNLVDVNGQSVSINGVDSIEVAE